MKKQNFIDIVNKLLICENCKHFFDLSGFLTSCGACYILDIYEHEIVEIDNTCENWESDLTEDCIKTMFLEIQLETS